MFCLMHIGHHVWSRSWDKSIFVWDKQVCQRGRGGGMRDEGGIRGGRQIWMKRGRRREGRGREEAMDLY